VTPGEQLGEDLRVYLWGKALENWEGNLIPQALAYADAANKVAELVYKYGLSPHCEVCGGVIGDCINPVTGDRWGDCSKPLLG
jgi:hypothetical protein